MNSVLLWSAECRCFELLASRYKASRKQIRVFLFNCTDEKIDEFHYNSYPVYEQSDLVKLTSLLLLLPLVPK